MMDPQKRLLTIVREARKRGAAERPAADLIGTPFVARNTVAARHGLSGQGAKSAIDTLVGLGILELGLSHRCSALVSGP